MHSKYITNEKYTNIVKLFFRMDSIECKDLSVLLSNKTAKHQVGTMMYDDDDLRRPSRFIQTVLPFLGGLGNVLNFVSCKIWY